MADNTFAGVYKAFDGFGKMMDAVIEETFDKDPKLIQADGEHRHQPRASSHPSPKSLEDIFGNEDEWFIVINSAEVNADLVMEV